MDSPFVTFERNVVMVYCSMSEDGNPWRLTYTTVDNRQFTALKGEMNHAMKRMAGISEQGNEWSHFLRVMIRARDSAVLKFIEARYADSEDVQPVSFHAAFLGANVPPCMQVAMPGFDFAHEMWVLTSSRKGTSVSIELTEENLAHVFKNVKHFSTNPIAQVQDAVEDDDGDEIVKYRKNNGKMAYLVEWRDAYGKWHKKWAGFKGESMRGIVKQELYDFYELHHVPEGDAREARLGSDMASADASDGPRTPSKMRSPSSHAIPESSSLKTSDLGVQPQSVESDMKRLKTYKNATAFWQSFGKGVSKAHADV